jgi:alkaline phosphatase
MGAAGLAVLPSVSLATPSGAKRRKPRNIIYCVSDGMPMSILTLANTFHQMKHGKLSPWASLLDDPEAAVGCQYTSSLGSLVTDSAAASSSWGSGVHIWNGALNCLPDGTKLRSLFQLLQPKGVLTGLVTTATITHATPAGFSINSLKRDDEAGIADRYLELQAHILMGGGMRFFDKSSRKDKKDLPADFVKSGYTFVKDRRELLNYKAGKLLGLFSPSHMPYVIDVMNTPGMALSTPSLADMSRVAINELKKGPSGFLLQIEGAKIDHAGHANDIGAMIYEQLAFEEAVQAAVDFARKDGETLVIVTADHGTGGPSLNGIGNEYGDSTKGLELVFGMKSSYGPMFESITSKPSASDLQGAVEAKLGVKLKSEDAAWLSGLIGGAEAGPGFSGDKSAALAHVMKKQTGIGWTSQNHTSDHVVVTAFGPGSEDYAGYTENISHFGKILSAWDVKHTNPTMSFEDAKKIMAKESASLNQDDELSAWHDGLI